MTIQHTHARELLNVLRHRVLAGQQPINGYHNAAGEIGLDGKFYARHMGQVCSRIDVATFKAGYPMLATHMVRKPNGNIPPSAFRGIWKQFEGEGIELALTHQWTAEQFDEVQGALDALPNIGALRMWEKIRDLEATQPGFIRYNLHRNVKR